MMSLGRSRARHRRGARVLAAMALVATGCVAAPPPPASPAQLGGCHPGAYSTRSELRCTRDADCLLCGDARRLTTRAQVQLTNEACPAPPAGGAAACCGGRCVSSLGPPRF